MGKRVFEKIVIYFSCLMDIIFPRAESCNGCGRIMKTPNKYRLCDPCFSRIKLYNAKEEDKWANSGISRIECEDVVISCHYEGLARDMVHELKYKDKREVAVSLAALISDKIDKKYLSYDYIVPVPISRKKMKKRGYNHISLIAAELSYVLNIPVLNCIERIKDTKPQVLFNMYDRWYNVKDCFKSICSTEGKKILLLDDIITTGATAHFCVEEIRASGATSITVVTFAKSNLL